MALICKVLNPTTGETQTTYSVIDRLARADKTTGVCRVTLDHWTSKAVRDAGKADRSLMAFSSDELDVPVEATFGAGGLFAAAYEAAKTDPRFAGAKDA